jgi:hypothetical protein
MGPLAVNTAGIEMPWKRSEEAEEAEESPVPGASILARMSGHKNAAVVK